MSGVEVATAALLRAWHREECSELLLQFKPRESGQVDDVLAALRDAIVAANVSLEGDDDPVAYAGGPWLAPTRRPAYDIHMGGASSDHAVVAWLEVFAGHLAAAGLAGKVAPVGKVDDSSWAVVEQMPLPQLTTFLALSMLDPAPSRGQPYQWNVDDAATATMAAEVEQASFPGAETYLLSSRLIRAAPAMAASALRRTLPRRRIAMATHLRPDPPRVLHWVFGTNGLVTRTLYDPTQTWQERLAQCTRALVALPEATELGFVQHVAGIGSGWNALNGGPPRLVGIRESDFRYNPHLRSRFVPDARGAMVLTDAHLERAHDLTGWSVQALGGGRHLVQAADPAAWFAGPEPAPEVLAEARADFGAMILTEADIERNPPPAPGARTDG